MVPISGSPSCGRHAQGLTCSDCARRLPGRPPARASPPSVACATWCKNVLIYGNLIFRCNASQQKHVMFRKQASLPKFRNHRKNEIYPFHLRQPVDNIPGPVADLVAVPVAACRAAAQLAHQNVQLLLVRMLPA